MASAWTSAASTWLPLRLANVRSDQVGRRARDAAEAGKQAVNLAIEHQRGNPPIALMRQRRGEGREAGPAIVRIEGTRPVDNHHDPGAAGNDGQPRRRVEPVVIQHALRAEAHDAEPAVDLADRRAAGQDDLGVGPFDDGARVELAGQRLLNPRALVGRRLHDAAAGRHGHAVDQDLTSRHGGTDDQLGSIERGRRRTSRPCVYSVGSSRVYSTVFFSRGGTGNTWSARWPWARHESSAGSFG